MNFSKTFIVFIILFFLFPVISNSQIYIGVNEFIGRNVSESETGALTDRLRIELHNTDKFEVIEYQTNPNSDKILVVKGKMIAGIQFPPKKKC